MQVSLNDAKAQLTDLVRRAEEGEDVVLTRDGHGVARLVSVPRRRSPAELHALVERVQASTSESALPGPDAARSQDFLYGENGLPA